MSLIILFEVNVLENLMETISCPRTTMVLLKLNLSRAPSQYHRAANIVNSELYYNLDSGPPQHNDGMKIIVVTDCLSAEPQATVYAGYFQSEEGKPGLSVALKFGDIDKLCVEANRYFAMESIQGSSIPRLVHLFFADIDDNNTCGCLVTEKFGDALPAPAFSYLYDWEK